MTVMKRFPFLFVQAAIFLTIMAVMPVFSQECTSVPGTRYNVGYIDRMLGQAEQFLRGCSDGNNNCREADKRLNEADVAIIQILTECTSTGSCLRGGIGTITNRAGRLAEQSKRLVRQSGMRRTYDGTLVTLRSWGNTRRCPTARCQQYARTAVSQNQENLRRRCGFTGARWTNGYQGHYTWCLRAQQSLADAETRARTDALRGCQPKTRSCPGPGMTVVHKLVNHYPYPGYSVICRDGSGKLWMQGANAAQITSIVKEQWNNQTGCHDRSKVVTSSGGTLTGRLCRP